MSCERYVLLQSDPVEDIESLQACGQSSSRFARVVLRACFAICCAATVLVGFSIHHAGFLLSAAGSATHLQLSESSLPVPKHVIYIGGSVLVVVVMFTIGNRILGRILKCLIVNGAHRMLEGTKVDIGRLAVAPCGGRMSLIKAGVCSPQGFTTDQKVYMLELQKAIFDLSMCRLWCSLIKNKLRGSAVVIEVEQFKLQNLIVRLEQKLTGENNLKMLVDQIQEVQKKFGPAQATKPTKKKAEPVKEKYILHKVDVTGLQLYVRGAGLNMPPVTLPPIVYVDFVVETKTTDDIGIALEIAGRILKTCMEEVTRQMKSAALSGINAIKEAPAVKALTESAEKAIGEAKEMSKKMHVEATQKIGETIAQHKKVVEEKALQVEAEAKKATAKLGEASKIATTSAKNFMEEMAQKAEALTVPISGASKDGKSTFSTSFPTPQLTASGPSAAVRAPVTASQGELRTPLIGGSFAPAAPGAASASASSQQPTSASASAAPAPGRPLDDSCNESGANFAAAAASLKDDLMKRVDSATTLVKDLQDRFNFCKGPSRTGDPDQEITFN